MKTNWLQWLFEAEGFVFGNLDTCHKSIVSFRNQNSIYQAAIQTSRCHLKSSTRFGRVINCWEFLASFSVFLSSLLKCTLGRQNFANVGTRTADLWCRKLPLNPLSHTRCHRPCQSFALMGTISTGLVPL